MPDKNDEQRSYDLFEVTIERILPGGRGIAYADGRTVMVALAGVVFVMLTIVPLSLP